MKKYIIVALIVLVGGAIIIVPLMKDNEPEGLELTPTVFAFDGDVGTVVGTESSVEIKVNEEGLSKVEVVYLDKVLKSWNSPKKGNLSFKIKPEEVGTSILQIISTRKDGTTYNDDCLFRVLSDINPEKLKVEIIETLDHNKESYTQGLEFYQGRLFESTGQRGYSQVSQINLGTGLQEGNAIQKLDGTYFGEGITILNDVVYQLTWQNGRCFSYELGDDSLFPSKDFSYVGQGWGLCNDGTSLIMSDGSERITFREPATFKQTKTISVYNNNGPMTELNELEFIDGKIYANVYLTNLVVVIDPETGKILQEIDCTELEKEGRSTGDVLNGIAYNPSTSKMYMTGKYWPKMFEVSFIAQ